MTTWTAPVVDRQHKAKAGDERTMLESLLDYHRATLLTKCAGLTAGQLKQHATDPSSMSLLGLIRHLTEVERGWFRRGAAHEDLDMFYCSEANPDGDFDDVGDADAEADYANHLAELDKVRAVAAGLSLNQTFTRNDTTFNVRWVYLHLIEEYARHNGHADLLRERIDGVTGE
ncbi:DinB family protein [Actinoplanes sp. NPDC051470]|uniref:DinB family protein n=1 Tax=Actinoplanes sp. NPDC051470 TaxID=3157224 RepID=UPI00342ED89C